MHGSLSCLCNKKHGGRISYKGGYFGLRCNLMMLYFLACDHEMWVMQQSIVQMKPSMSEGIIAAAAATATATAISTSAATSTTTAATIATAATARYYHWSFYCCFYYCCCYYYYYYYY